MGGMGNGYDSAIDCDGVHGIQRFYRPTTQETVWADAPCWAYHDFEGILGGDPFDGTITWSVVEVLLNTAIAQLADQPCGVMTMIIDADNNAEDAVIYFGDQRSIDLNQHANIEFGIAMPILPTGGAPASGTTVVFGLAHDHNLDKDTVATHAWFRLQGAASILCETDDTTNDNDDVDTGIDLVAGEYHVFRIDAYDIADVHFYIDGNRVCTGTTFDMSNCTADEAIMQPYISLDKPAVTTVGTLNLDYVKWWTSRTFYEGP
jgi:hypothetical protein